MDVLDVGDHHYVIDRATMDDLGALVELLRDDRLGSAREAPALDVYELAFGMIDQGPHQFLACVRDPEGSPVGTMQLTLIPGLSRGGCIRLQIEAVRIAASARGSGLGTAMLAWAHAFGRARGARLAQLTTDKSRSDAHRFYARLGYEASHEGLKLEL